MSASQPTCALGLSPATLSAWRDAMLDPAEASRLASHIAGCAGCQARLTDYETIAGAVRAERVPSPDARLWRELRARMLVTPRHGQRGPHALPGGWRASLAAAVAVLVVVAGFARLFGLGAGQRSVSPAWRNVSLPQGVGFYYQHGLGLSAADGNTAYACAAAYGPSGQPPTPGDLATHVYVTHDRGQSWTRVSDLPAGMKARGCYVVADASDPLTAIATESEATSEGELGAAPTGSFLTHDGGATWQPLTDPQQQEYTIREFATTSIRAFGLRSQDQAPGPLVASDDGMRSWYPIDQTITSAGDHVLTFWVVPGSGVSLLAESVTSSGNRLDLWLTEDGGKVWTRVSRLQVAASAPPLYAVLVPASGTTWQACAVSYGATAGAAPEIVGLLCTADGGRTWTARPSAPLPGNGGNTVFALGDDGALLGIVVRAQTTTLYRLPAGASQWQSLGSTPEQHALPTYVPAPDDGVLWLQPHVYNTNDALDPHGAVYTMAYGSTPAVAPTRMPAPSPTATPAAGIALPGPTLAWSSISSAPRAGANQNPGPASDELFVAPSDGTTAYVCIAGDESHSSMLPQVWRTRDTGASWQRMTDVPSRAQANMCQMLVDPGDALHVVAVLWYLPNGAGGGPDIRTYQNFVSSDGGASWTPVSTPSQAAYIVQFASYHSVTYAIRSVLAGNGVDTELYASADGMQSWRSLTSTLTGAGVQYVKGFWLNQATGTLLVQTGYQDISTTLWRSDDGGQQWIRLTLAPTAADTSFLAQASGSGPGWLVCARYDQSFSPPSNRFACSHDGGRSWNEMPALAADDRGATITSTQPLAVTGDGTLLVLGTAGQSGPTRLYLLSPGAPQWQEFGQSPAAPAALSPIAYASSPGAGVLWGAANGRLYVARYP